MNLIRSLIIVGLISCLSVFSFAENKEKNSERNPAQVNTNQTIELIGHFSNGAKVERLFSGVRANSYLYQIIDEKREVICYAGTSGMSCVSTK